MLPSDVRCSEHFSKKQAMKRNCDSINLMIQHSTFIVSYILLVKRWKLLTIRGFLYTFSIWSFLMNRHKFKENFDHFKINTLHKTYLYLIIAFFPFRLSSLWGYFQRTHSHLCILDVESHVPLAFRVSILGNFLFFRPLRQHLQLT